MEKLHGIHKVVIRFKTKHCFIRYNPKKHSPKSLVKALKKIGYKASLDKTAKWPKKKKKKRPHH